MASPPCYRPDGSQMPASYAPCKLGGPSMCCRIADARENAPDICRPDGLCQSTSNTDYIWRESCTDASWKSSQCLQLCVDGSDRSTDVILTFCSNGSICCGLRNTPCCEQGRGVFLVDGKVVSSTASSSTSTGSSTSTPPSGPTGSAPPPPAQEAPSSSTSLSTGAALGVGVVIGAVAIGICGIAVFFFLRRRRLRGAPAVAQPAAPASELATKDRAEFPTYTEPVPPVRTPPVELNASEWKGGR